MPHIILKKTFKIKGAGFQVAAEKSFSFHGMAVSQELVAYVNDRLQRLRFSHGSNRPQFKRNQQGHYYASMNHDCQKYHEDDCICAILDVMAELGWTFRFQYDSESQSVKLNGSSMTSKELFIFHKVPASQKGVNFSA